MNKFFVVFLFAAINFCCVSNGYDRNFYSFTEYNLADYSCYTTEDNISIYYDEDFSFLRENFFAAKEEIANEVSQKTKELEDCLGIKIKRKYFVVLIPKDWYISKCSQEQLLPYSAPADLCRDKGLDIPKYCEGLNTPTEECPCICNWRVVLQDNYIIVTPPNLILYKAELSRLVTGVNNPWEDENISRCL